MKAITLTQPWASLVAAGSKRIETRSWSSAYRGPLAIHAAKGWKADDRTAAVCEPFYKHLRAALGPEANVVADLPRGAILAVVQLVDVVRIGPRLPVDVFARFMVAPDEEAFGNYAPGRFAWLLNHPIVVPPEPIEARGALSLWDVPPSIETALWRAAA